MKAKLPVAGDVEHAFAEDDSDNAASPTSTASHGQLAPGADDAGAEGVDWHQRGQ